MTIFRFFGTFQPKMAPGAHTFCMIWIYFTLNISCTFGRRFALKESLHAFQIMIYFYITLALYPSSPPLAAPCTTNSSFHHQVIYRVTLTQCNLITLKLHFYMQKCINNRESTLRYIYLTHFFGELRCEESDTVTSTAWSSLPDNHSIIRNR